MERKYTETDKELMLKLLEMQELTAPISLSIGSVVNGQVTQGIILHEAPPKVVEDLVKDGYSCSLSETGLRVYKLWANGRYAPEKKLYRLVAKAKKGESSKAKVDECFNGWKDHAAKGTSYQLLRRMEAYYKELWRNQDGISTDQNKRL